MVRRAMLRLTALLLAGCAGDRFELSSLDLTYVSVVDEAGESVGFSSDEIALLRTMWPLPDVAEDTTNAVADDPWAQQLGQYLFFDKGLSGTGTVSCATCHDPQLGWADDLQLAHGLARVDRHSMSLLNTGSNRWYFWDGRCDTQWCQALQPIEHPSEMGGNRLSVIHTVAEDEALSMAYAETFGNLPDTTAWPEAGRPVVGDPEHPHAVAWASLLPEDREAANRIFANLGKAIAAFERRLVSRDSPYDRFAEALLTQGEVSESAIDASAMRGLKIFVGDGRCHFCHSGPAFTNREFGNVGLDVRDWIQPGDRGRLDGIIRLWDEPFSGMGEFSDDTTTSEEKILYLTTTGEQEGQFKVPSLRSVALSPPYMHGGHFDTLEDVVRHYGEVTEYPEYGHREDLLLEVSLDDQQVADLVAFLESLTGAPLPETLESKPDSPIFDP